MISEKETSWYSTTLSDRAGQPITQGNIATLTITIYESGSRNIVNSIEDLDVTNSGAWGGRASISAAGLLEIRIEPNDNSIINSPDDASYETHVMIITGTTLGIPSETFRRRFSWDVENLYTVS